MNVRRQLSCPGGLAHSSRFHTGCGLRYHQQSYLIPLLYHTSWREAPQSPLDLDDRLNKEMGLSCDRSGSAEVLREARGLGAQSKGRARPTPHRGRHFTSKCENTKKPV